MNRRLALSITTIVIQARVGSVAFVVFGAGFFTTDIIVADQAIAAIFVDKA